MVLLFDVDETLLACSPDRAEDRCIINEDGIDFLKWVTEFSDRYRWFDPHIIAWTNGLGTLHKFETALRTFINENPQKVASHPSIITDYNLAKYFTG